MGRERTGKRKHIQLYLALCVTALLGLAACGGLSAKRMGAQELENARAAMARGDYEAAMQKNRELFTLYLRTQGDEALFMMGMLYADPRNPGADLGRSLEHFQRLVSLFPESDRALEARAWVLVLGDLAGMREKRGLLEREIMDLQGRVAEKEGVNSQMRTDLRKKSGEIAEMKKRIRSLEENLHRLQAQLERLKGVDLGIEKKRREVVPR
jgi:hypothetical protein